MTIDVTCERAMHETQGPLKDFTRAANIRSEVGGAGRACLPYANKKDSPCPAVARPAWRSVAPLARAKPFRSQHPHCRARHTDAAIPAPDAAGAGFMGFQTRCRAARRAPKAMSAHNERAQTLATRSRHATKSRANEHRWAERRRCAECGPNDMAWKSSTRARAHTYNCAPGRASPGPNTPGDLK